MTRITFIILFLTSFQVNARIKIKNLSLVVPDTNILEKHFRNEIKVLGLHKMRFYVTCTNSKVEIDGDQLFLTPSQNNPDTITIFSNKKRLFQQVFNIQQCSDPTYKISGFLDSIISKEQLLAIPNISIYCFDCLLECKTHFFGFSMMIFPKDKPTSRLSSNDYKYTVEMIQNINLLCSGDRIIIQDVKVGGPDKRIRSLGDRIIRIK